MKSIYDATNPTIIEHVSRIVKVNMVQVSASVDMKLGGPASVVIGINPYLDEHFSNKVLIFGNSDYIFPKSFVFPTIGNNRYGFFLNKRLLIAKDLLKNCEILLVHGFYLYSTIFAVLCSKTSKIFLMPHGSLEPYQESKSIFKKSLFKFVLKLTLRGRKLKFIVGSESEELNVRKLFPGHFVETVGIGISNEIINNDLDSKILGDQITLICYSRITQKKRIDLCIRALAELDRQGYNVVLRIVGAGEEKLSNDLRALGQLLGISSKIVFEGFVPNGKETQNIFRSADIFLLPSENENFAVAVAESIGYGVPVIVSKYVAMHKFVEEFKTGLTISKLSVSNLTNAILEVKSNYSFYRENCVQSRKLLGWENVSNVWIEKLTT